MSTNTTYAYTVEQIVDNENVTTTVGNVSRVEHDFPYVIFRDSRSRVIASFSDAYRVGRTSDSSAKEDGVRVFIGDQELTDLVRKSL